MYDDCQALKVNTSAVQAVYVHHIPEDLKQARATSWLLASIAASAGTAGLTAEVESVVSL